MALTPNYVELFRENLDPLQFYFLFVQTQISFLEFEGYNKEY